MPLRSSTKKMRAVTPIQLRSNQDDIHIQKAGANTPGDPKISINPNPKIQIYDTTIQNLVNNTGEFDTPEALETWFQEKNKENYFVYLYGLGKILKTKQELLQKASSSLKQKIDAINTDYDSGISEVSRVVPQLSSNNPDFKKKEGLINSVVSDINDSYKTQFQELLLKKIRYDETIEKIKERRAYLVFHFNTEDQGYAEIVENQIMPLARDLYSSYRGLRYKDLRKMVYSYVVICAYNPEIIEKSFILNTSITGPAGSGKTTLARKLANWFSAVGFITRDSFLENPDASYREVGAPELIAQYVGQTAPRTLGVLYSSLEQCLFIDEAYSVAGCSFDQAGKLQPSAYGEEFIAVLLPFMANHQGVGCLFVAGYKNLMETCFFQRNEGLPRRFPTKIDLPLYTTDELYDMFLNYNIIKKQVASIRAENPNEMSRLKKEFRRGKQIIYVGVKPAFLMFHYDTSYTAFEILRKYLLLYSIRNKQFTKGNYTKLAPTHSYTITNHVLTCMMTSLLRRNILRYYFYKKIFNFTSQNLSLFPAQAGEMGLVADMFNRKVEVFMNEQKQRKIYQGYISIEQETDVFDTYFESKFPRLVYFQEEGKPAYVEIIQRGYETEKTRFQQKIKEILIKEILPQKEVIPPTEPEPTISKKVTKEQYEQAKKNFKMLQKLKNERELSAKEKADLEQLNRIILEYTSAEVKVPTEDDYVFAKTEIEYLKKLKNQRILTGEEESDYQKAQKIMEAYKKSGKPIPPDAAYVPPGIAVPPPPVPNYKKQQGGAADLPSLQELWELLFNDTTTLMTKAIDTYVKIAKEVIPELLMIREDKFPVNMIKSEVENEQILIGFYEENPSNSGLFKSEMEGILTAKLNYTGQNSISLQHPYLLKRSQNEKQMIKNKENALWEDFAFKDKD